MSGPYEGDSNDANTPGIKGVNTAISRFDVRIGTGVWGSGGDYGVNTGIGVGVWGESSLGGAGVQGENSFDGVGGPGVVGTSSGGDGVHGESKSNPHAGVSGINNSGGPGVYASGNPAGHFEGNVGIGTANPGSDVDMTGGLTINGTNATQMTVQLNGTSAFALNCASGQWTMYDKVGGTWNPSINSNGGNVEISKNLQVTGDVVLTGADFAEDFAVEASAEPGTIMVLDENGVLRPCDKSYDRKVAGVISGAGDHKPGLILDRQKSSEGRLPLALVGKVYCKVDAAHGAIEVGDLLTTSPTPGHAMKASDPLKAFGAVIGKALRPLADGQGLIPILIALQ